MIVFRKFLPLNYFYSYYWIYIILYCISLLDYKLQEGKYSVLFIFIFSTKYLMKKPKKKKLDFYSKNKVIGTFLFLLLKQYTLKNYWVIFI